MACIICKVSKLSEEFPPYNASSKCDHACLTCLRCLVNCVSKNGRCPYPDCPVEISGISDEIVQFKELLSKMFTEYEEIYTESNDACGNENFVNVSVLTGECTRIPFAPSMTVLDLKNQIQQHLHHETSKQKLLYRGKEMNVVAPNGGYAKLSEYQLKSNATVCLVVCLYSIPDDLDHVVFDLFWGYPIENTHSFSLNAKPFLKGLFGGVAHTGTGYTRDYLDASCLMFKKTSYSGEVDFSHKKKPGIEHSGDVMDDKNRIGHHTIDLHLKKIPTDITHLFFTLSAWSSPTISKFPNPSLKFYDASNKGKDLCSTSFTHANSSQAVIMCSLSKKNGRWQIYESGKLSAGNANDYDPLVDTIGNLISVGF